MNKRILMILGGLVLLVVLVAGAFTAVRLLATPDETATASSGSGARMMQSVQQIDDGAPVSVQTTILPAPELPDEPTAASGVFVRREDNSIVVGTGNIDLEVDVSVDPETGQETTTLTPRTDGPEIEVVMTHDTLVYRDVTDFSLDGAASDAVVESGEREIVQAVKQVEAADEIGENMELQVWGERSGDRIIATIVVYGPLGGGAFE